MEKQEANSSPLNDYFGGESNHTPNNLHSPKPSLMGSLKNRITSLPKNSMSKNSRGPLSDQIATVSPSECSINNNINIQLPAINVINY